MGQPRWVKIQRDTGCTEKQARTYSRAFLLLGEFKGTVLTMPPEMIDYAIDKMGKEILELMEYRNPRTEGDV